MSSGVLLFANNNDQLDYGSMSMACSLLQKRHMGKPVCLVTDDGTVSWMVSQYGRQKVDSAFDHIVIKPTASESTRKFHDGPYAEYSLPWKNFTRVDAYDLTPFESTLMMDVDYLVLSDLLNLCWDSGEDILMNKDIRFIDGSYPSDHDVHVSPFGITMYWATVLFFRKSWRSKHLFSIASHVRDNYPYYTKVYDLPPGTYRNDHAFSIAAHVISGYISPGSVLSLPTGRTRTSTDMDHLMEIQSDDAILFMAQNRAQPWKFLPVRVFGTDVHVMNKFSLSRAVPSIIARFS